MNEMKTRRVKACLYLKSARLTLFERNLKKNSLLAKAYDSNDFNLRLFKFISFLITNSLNLL